jgi:hypothetical protein
MIISYIRGLILQTVSVVVNSAYQKSRNKKIVILELSEVREMGVL